MPLVRITDEAYHIFLSKTEGEVTDLGHRIDSGDWMIPLSNETIASIWIHSFPGETFSNTITRVLSTAGRKPN